MVGGRHEQFGDILDMITYWEDMEEGKKYNIKPEEGGGRVRRRSKRMSELCERFEEGEEGSSSQSGGGEGRGECILYILEKTEMIYRIGRSYQFQNYLTSKKNESSPCNIPRDQLGSDQQTGSKRKSEINHVRNLGL